MRNVKIDKENSSRNVRLDNYTYLACSVAVLYTLITVGENWFDYINGASASWGRIITSSLGVLGWCVVLVRLIIVWINNGKKQHSSR